MNAFEVNFDGLVGPTHNYAGLAYGNIASVSHRLVVSNPRAAFLEGLDKMKLLKDLGVKQAVLPPQERPDLHTLRRLGFAGTDAQVVSTAAETEPVLLAACYSASAMWAANAATVSPGADTLDGRVHFTPANLLSHLHRSIETRFTTKLLKTIFSNGDAFIHHEPLPSAAQFSDEGAANHTRLCGTHGNSGIELFVYGRKALELGEQGPRIFPGRQTLEASRAVARLHGLKSERTVFAEQNPAAIDSGVFHNDVISVGNEYVFFYHELAFADSEGLIEELKREFVSCSKRELILIPVSARRLSVAEAVDTYLFNSQLVTLPDGDMCLVAPAECCENRRVRAVLDDLLSGPNPISRIEYCEVRQSMQNGGGPACLRLRVALTERELALAHQGVFLTDSLYEALRAWAFRHYRDRLHGDDLSDPALIMETRTALDELSGLLGLGSIYSFQ